MKRILLSLAVLALLVSCQKQISPEDAEVKQPLPTAIYSTTVDSTRMHIARGIANCLQSRSFRQGLSEGLSLMRDGDNEVLLAEIFLPVHTRGLANWSSEVASQLAEQLGIKTTKTRGAVPAVVFESLLAQDPLMQVLFVPANDDYTQEEIDLNAENLKIVTLPEDYDEHSQDLLLAYDRWGNETFYDPQDEVSPLIVVGSNERLEYVANGTSPEESDLVYLQISSGRYIPKHFDPVDSPENPKKGKPRPSWPPKPTPKPLPVKRVPLLTSENIIKARFTSNSAMREYESRVLGRPEVRFIALMEDLHSGLIANQSWKDARWVYINNEIGYWVAKALLRDYYTVKWVEIDDVYGSLELTITSQLGGVEMTNTFSIRSGDDYIGQQCVYFQSSIDENGYRTYRLGDTFEFTIQVAKS